MNQTGINVPMVIAVLRSQWKFILTISFFAALIATIVVLIVPRQYRSSATLVAANPILADKGNLFNDHIQHLYSYYGNGDDLDRIRGIAVLDTNLKRLVDEFALVPYYKLSGKDSFLLRSKAVKKLQNDLVIFRTEEGQLKIAVWTRDRILSAQLVNRLLEFIETTAEKIWKDNYERNRKELTQSIYNTELEYQHLYDSLTRSNSKQYNLLQIHMQTLLDQLKKYRSAAEQFKVAEQTAPPVMYVLEQAVPAARSERPKRTLVVLSAALAGCCFSILWSLFMAGKQRN